MENEIESKVKGITRRVAKILEENSGIEAQFENKDREDYVKVGPQEPYNYNCNNKEECCV